VQLWGAIEAVWMSWTLKKAVDYRRVNGISETLGTASASWPWCFGKSRRRLGDWRGIHPRSVDGRETFLRRVPDQRAGRRRRGRYQDAARHRGHGESVAHSRSRVARDKDRLERHFRDMQDIEFTVERGKLYLLQTRTGKRTAAPRCASRARWWTRA
jgi:pyruvate,orthophosphate dikinase